MSVLGVPLRVVWACCFLALWPVWAAAQGELHYVGVARGQTGSGDAVHGPRADLRIDRPGAEVSVILASSNPLRWHIELAEGSEIDTIYMAGRGGGTSEVYLAGARYLDVTDLPDVKHMRRPSGPAFRAFLTRLEDWSDFTRLDGFQGFGTAPGSAIEVTTRDPDDPNLGPDHLRGLAVGPGVLSPKLRDAYETGGNYSQAATLRVDGQGVALQRHDGSWQEFAIGLDVPALSHPKGSVFVPSENAIYVVTLGGEGFLYRIDANDGTWQVVRSMENVDVTGMFHDAEGKRLIMFTLDHRSPTGFLQFDLTTMDWRPERHPLWKAPGFQDFGYTHNRTGAALRVLGIDGDHLLLRAQPRRDWGGKGPDPYRIWSFNLKTGETALIAYEHAPQ